MKIFVTGGSGFVGGHLVERLARAGHEVRALARSADSASMVARYGAKAVRGDLDTLSAAEMADAEVVVHAAAYVKSFGPRAAFVAGNVEGTRRALEAAKTAGVKRFVHISTEAILFDGGDLLEVDETRPPPARQRYLYSETKAAAEHVVLSANAPGFTTLALRPRLVWGPRDASVLPEVLEAAKKGAFAWLDQGRQRTSTTFVGNLAAAVELALTRGTGGEAYFIADDGTQSMREFLTALAKTQQVDLPSRSIPGALARPLASFVEKTWSLFAPSRKPPMVGFSVAMLSRSVTVKTDKARRDLGYAPETSVADGLAALARG
ncbi:MAG: NAD-dependent epimerase/dehydratase family protein [Archangium sp.]|nr:NAD-dependent epimerase/dehydratase family protein [Archangium sp.]